MKKAVKVIALVGATLLMAFGIKIAIDTYYDTMNPLFFDEDADF